MGKEQNLRRERLCGGKSSRRWLWFFLTLLILIPGDCCATPRPDPVSETSRRPTATKPRAPRVKPPVSRRRPQPQTVDGFLDDIEQRTFRFFWDTAHPRTRLVPDRWPTRSFASVAAVGFALTTYPIGAERGWVERDAAALRTKETLDFLASAPQGPEAAGRIGYKGFYYHFLDMETGARFGQVELSTIDTALLMAGALTAAEYFNGSDPVETAIRSRADELYRRVEWTWAQNHPPLLSLGWKPESGFLPYDYRGYNETMILYLLALGSPTFPIGPAAWEEFTRGYQWADFYGFTHVNFGPLFGHQFSHVWVDFRGIQDPFMRGKGIDYFENSRRAAYSQRAYAIANPKGFSAYSGEIWGLTACDGPADALLKVNGQTVQTHTYWDRGVAVNHDNDDGTLAPTAAGGAIAFAPEIVIPTLQEFVTRYGEYLYGGYGFFDAFNPTFELDVTLQHGRLIRGWGWFDTDYLGIDQGPILTMIENHRSGLIWKLTRKSHPLIDGLRRAGFTGGWLDQAP